MKSIREGARGRSFLPALKALAERSFPTPFAPGPSAARTRQKAAQRVRPQRGPCSRMHTSSASLSLPTFHSRAPRFVAVCAP